MCTAATYHSAGFYFGRTLDYEVSYGNQIVITPRNYALRFRHTDERKGPVHGGAEFCRQRCVFRTGS